MNKMKLKINKEESTSEFQLIISHMYKMEMEFEVVVGLKEINEFMNYMGFPGNTRQM